MIIIKKYLNIFYRGIVFGFGFSIAVWGIYFILQGLQDKAQEPPASRNEAITGLPAPVKNNNFTFQNVEEVKRNGQTYFVGMVKNNSTSIAKGVSIEINLFLKEKFVDQYSTYVTGNIGAGQEKYFKISCGCKNDQPAEHDSYRISIVGGY